jgi:hypothetical protein
MASAARTSDPDRRRHRRVRLAAAAAVALPGRSPRPCRIHNISASGALVETAEPLRLGESVRLAVESAGTVWGRVVRVSSSVAALAFDAENTALAGLIAARIAAMDAASAPAESGETRSAS